MANNQEIIDLDSETDQSSEEVQISSNSKAEVIDLSSDDAIVLTDKSDIEEENVDIDEVSSKRGENEPILPLEETIITTKEQPDEKLTQQQKLRKRMADAAEKRIRINASKNSTNDDPIDFEQSSKRQKTIQSNTKESNNFTKTSKLPKPITNDKSSRIRLISNPSYCSEFNVNADVDTVSLNELIGSEDLVKTYQFNMLIDFDYLSRFVTSKDCEFILVNKSDDEHLHIKDESWEKWKIHTVDVSLRLPKFGTHHSKMMINFYKGNICKIIIHTMNITEADHLIQTQMCWISPELQFQSDQSKWLDFNQPNISVIENTGLAFKRDFIAYLMTYENNDINKLIDQIAKFDFTPIDVLFIGSSPGHYEYDNWSELSKPISKPMFGYGRLWQLIHMLNLESLHGKLIGQVSTIAGPCDNWKRNIFLHVLTSCVEKGYPMIKKTDYKFTSKNHVEPMIIWPTINEVLKSKASALSGIALHLTSKGKWAAYERQFNDIKKFFYKWSNFVDNPKLSKAGRSNLSPHVKTYTVTEDNFKTLKWFLMTSANISHQAWGKPKSYNVIEYDISSFEAGIFVAPNLLKVNSNIEKKKQVLIPTYGRDSVTDESSLIDNTFKIGIRLPYDTPLIKYTISDKPWNQPDCDQFF